MASPHAPYKAKDLLWRKGVAPYVTRVLTPNPHSNTQLGHYRMNQPSGTMAESACRWSRQAERAAVRRLTSTIAQPIRLGDKKSHHANPRSTPNSRGHFQATPGRTPRAAPRYIATSIAAKPNATGKRLVYQGISARR